MSGELIKTIQRALVGTPEHRMREQSRQRESLLLGKNYKIRNGGVLGLIERLNRKNSATSETQGGAGSNEL